MSPDFLHFFVPPYFWWPDVSVLPVGICFDLPVLIICQRFESFFICFRCMSTDCILFHTGQCLLWLHSSSCRVVGEKCPEELSPIWHTILSYHKQWPCATRAKLTEYLQVAAHHLTLHPNQGVENGLRVRGL